MCRFLSGKFVRPIVHDTPIKFRDLCLNRIRPEAVAGGIFDRCLNFDKYQPEVASDVVFGVVVESTDMEVSVNCGLPLPLFELLSWLQKRFSPPVRPNRPR